MDSTRGSHDGVAAAAPPQRDSDAGLRPAADE